MVFRMDTRDSFMNPPTFRLFRFDEEPFDLFHGRNPPNRFDIPVDDQCGGAKDMVRHNVFDDFDFGDLSRQIQLFDGSFDLGFRHFAFGAPQTQNADVDHHSASGDF